MHFNRDLAQEPIHKKAHISLDVKEDEFWAKPFHFEEPLIIWPKSASLEVDFNALTDSSFRVVEAELPPIQPIQWFPPITPLPERKTPVKSIKKPTVKRQETNVVIDDWSDLEAYPCILWSESHKYVGHYVMIKRFGKWIKHHWVAEHDRLTNVLSTPVCGHYTRGKR